VFTEARAGLCAQNYGLARLLLNAWERDLIKNLLLIGNVDATVVSTR
jgi:hypothetical protein